MQAQAAQPMQIKPLIPLCLAAFTGFLNLFGINPFFVDIADEIDSSVSMVGYSATGALLMTSLAAAIVGPVAQRVGTRRTLVAGLLVAALGAAVTGLAFNFGGLILGRLLAGTGGAVTGGVSIGLVALLYEGRQRQRALAIVTASMAMAVVIGAFLMTSAAEPFGWRGAFLILGGVLVIVSVLVRIGVESAQDDNAAGRRRGPIQILVDAYRPIVSYRPLRPLLVACMLHPSVMNGGTSYVGALFVSQHDTSVRAVGLVFSLIGVTYVVGNVLAGNIGERTSRINFSAGVLMMGTFWMIGYVAPVSPLITALLFSLATLGGGLSWVTLLSMIADRAPANPGTAMVLTTSLHSLGGAIGTALGAGLLDISGYWGIGIGLAVVGAIAAVLGWVSSRAPMEASTSTGTRESSRERSRADRGSGPY